MGGGRYEGAYSGFTDVGTYSIAVYVTDTEGNISLAKQTQVTQNGTGGVCAPASAEASVTTPAPPVPAGGDSGGGGCTIGGRQNLPSAVANTLVLLMPLLVLLVARNLGRRRKR